MAYFFTSTYSYSLGQKTHTSCFFSTFCNKMVFIICAVLTIAIKHLSLRWNNQELVSEKSTVQFEPTSQRKSNSNYTYITLGLKPGDYYNTSKEAS